MCSAVAMLFERQEYIIEEEEREYHTLVTNMLSKSHAPSIVHVCMHACQQMRFILCINFMVM